MNRISIRVISDVMNYSKEERRSRVTCKKTRKSKQANSLVFDLPTGTG